MSEGRPKRVKTAAGINTSLHHPGQRQRNVDCSGSFSTQGGRNHVWSDPYYAPALQAERLAKFMAWMVEQVGGLASDASPIGDYNNELWKLYDATEMYKSCLRSPHYYVQCELTKVGPMIIEKRLIHYLIAYVLVQRNTNHAQTMGNDLKLMYVVKEGIMRNTNHAQPMGNDLNLMYAVKEGIRVISDITSSSYRLLAYDIFISRVIEPVGIDISNEELTALNPMEHLIDDSLIHKMDIYKYGGLWM
ncbi:hypothetical protein Lal_00033765 [Lupinus albus]|nr:hypothetical protein Lal_00033765 [Lupinus albus]